MSQGLGKPARQLGASLRHNCLNARVFHLSLSTGQYLGRVAVLARMGEVPHPEEQAQPVSGMMRR